MTDSHTITSIGRSSSYVVSSSSFEIRNPPESRFGVSSLLNRPMKLPL
jgi:hypothetical protein